MPIVDMGLGLDDFQNMLHYRFFCAAEILLFFCFGAMVRVLKHKLSSCI